MSTPHRRCRSALLTLTTLLAAFSFAGSPLSAQAGGGALKIGLIGAGNMGGPLGKMWADAGHQVFYSSRHPEELTDLVAAAAPRAQAGLPDAAVAFGDVIVLAVPPSAIPQIGQDYGDLMKGKIVIDITNPRADRDGPITDEWLAMGTGLAMAQYLPGARVVKAFNTLSSRMLGNTAPNGERIGVPVAGDDAEAVRVVASLVREAGFEPVIVGPLARAKEFDRGSPVWVTGMTAPQVREALHLPPSP